MTEYRVEYQITRYGPDDDDFVEIGFGSSGAWDSPEQAAHIAAAAIQNYEWETEPGMPAPEDIEAEVSAVTK